MVSIINVSSSVEHPLKQEEHQNQEERDDLRRTKSIKRYSSCSKTLGFVFSWDILPVNQSIDIYHHQNKENLREEIFTWLDLLKLVRNVWMFSSLSAIDIFLSPMHILWQHLAIEIGNLVEEPLDIVPSFLIPSALLVHEDLLMHICEQICSFISGSHVGIFVVHVLRVQLEAGIFVNVIFIFDIVPCSNFWEILLMEKQDHQE